MNSTPAGKNITTQSDLKTHLPISIRHSNWTRRTGSTCRTEAGSFTSRMTRTRRYSNSTRQSPTIPLWSTRIGAGLPFTMMRRIGPKRFSISLMRFATRLTELNWHNSIPIGAEHPCGPATPRKRCETLIERFQKTPTMSGLMQIVAVC